MADHVSDFVLSRLREWGVHRIYGYPGDGINGFLGALDRAEGDPEFIQARHEEMAAFMACGHAKFTDEVGCCIVGPPLFVHGGLLPCWNTVRAGTFAAGRGERREKLLDLISSTLGALGRLRAASQNTSAL